MAEAKTASPFDSVIKEQHTTGYWPVSAMPALALFCANKITDDADVLEALDAMTLAEGAVKNQVYTTLLAIYILMEVFADQEDEWTLLVRKAKDYLKQAGIDKPDKVLRKFDLEVSAPK